MSAPATAADLDAHWQAQVEEFLALRDEALCVMNELMTRARDPESGMSARERLAVVTKVLAQAEHALRLKPSALEVQREEGWMVPAEQSDEERAADRERIRRLRARAKAGAAAEADPQGDEPDVAQ